MADKKEAVIAKGDDGVRLDRWFKRHVPQMPFAMLQKLLRKGQVRLDGKKAEANTRLAAGQVVTYPEVEVKEGQEPRKTAPRTGISDEDRALMRSLVVYEDEEMIVINKPAGLATQGGSGVKRSVDGLAVTLVARGQEKPKLVHRLDRDTSGLLVLARTTAAARRLTALLRERAVEKWYLAVVVGVPSPREGIVDAPMEKLEEGAGKEKMQLSGDGKKAFTEYVVVDEAHKTAALVAMQPLTGRTHQLRVHALALGTPILGDGKYGGREAFLSNADKEFERRLHLHARKLVIPRKGKKPLVLTAPLPPHMKRTMELLRLQGDV